MGDLSSFERGWMVGACLDGVSVIKAPTLLGASSVTVSKVRLTYTIHEKTTSEKGTVGESQH
jgi:hypothetical protein